MATYNGGAFVKTQISSILEQLSPDDELIISDDGSTDDTIDNIYQCKDERIKLYSNISSRKGPVGNFENALRQAKGDFIFLSDQDDLWLPGRVKKHIELLQQYTLVISDAIVVDGHGNVIYESFFFQRKSKKGLLKNIMRNSYIGCCMSFRKSLLDKALPFPSKIHMHDWWLGLVAETVGTVKFCDEKYLRYVRHESNASPMLGQSNYSALLRLKNRLYLIFSLISIYFYGRK